MGDGGDVSSGGDAVAAVSFRKRARGGAGIRKKETDVDTEGGAVPLAGDDDDEGGSAVVKRERKEAASVFVQKTRTVKKDASDMQVLYSSSGTAATSVPTDQNATALLEVDTAQDRDAEALLLKRIAISKDLAEKGMDNVYRGQAGYVKYDIKQDAEKGAKYRVGPQRAAANIRTTIRFDYQPDVCKDYKETGFCGYGDSCKFLHDRSDYKAGWQLEREWDEEQKAKRKRAERGEKEGGDDGEEEEPEEDLPFACLICREEFTSPVVTKCVSLRICLLSLTLF